MHHTSHADANPPLVYSVNKAVIADGVGRRLENFFWRIWSCRKLLHRISGRQVALQFQHISEGGYFRTTPTQSPRISRSLASNETGSPSDGRASASLRETSPSVDRPRGTRNEGQEEKRERDHLASPVESVPPRSQETVAPLPSILKKPKVAFATHSSKTAKVLGPDASLSRKSGDDDDGGGPLSANAPHAEAVNHETASSPQRRQQSPTEENAGPNIGDERGPRRRTMARERALIAEKSTGSQEDAKPKSTGKRAVLVKTGASKRRPIIAQRKSSQSSSSTASQLTASPATGINVGSAASTQAWEANAGKSAHDQDQSGMQRSRHGSPHPSQRRNAAMEDQNLVDESHGKPKNEGRGIEDGLVDRDFRSRFAIRSRAHGHLFAPFPGKSAAAAATSANDQAIGTTDSAQDDKSKCAEPFTDEIVRLKPPGSSGPRAKDDSEAQPLPRTKSQLTLLLERDRQRNQDGNHEKEAR